MKTIIDDFRELFKILEKKTFAGACKQAQEYTRGFLEELDKLLMEERDKKKYRHKGYHQTTVKMIYGEVTFKRAVYLAQDEDGLVHCVYLLDEVLGLGEYGLLSQNMVDHILSSIPEMSYRNCAELISRSCGQSISKMGVWNIVQMLGKKVEKDEEALVEANEHALLHADVEAPVLFEEIDGVNIKLQGKDRKASKSGAAEMKVAIAYTGWQEIEKGRYKLTDKTAIASMDKSKDFHKKREAMIAANYDMNSNLVRILNGDGASWIKKVPDKDTEIQLDVFHRNQAIKTYIHHPKAVQDIFEILKEQDINELFRYLDIYKNSVEAEEEKDADKLISYFQSNRDGLIPYLERKDAYMPASPEGIEYRKMGTMENHIWSIAARRMKHNHACWSINGANNLAKILAKKSCGRLNEVSELLDIPVYVEEPIEEDYKVLSAAAASKVFGKGYEYPYQAHLPVLDEALRGDRKKLLALAGF